MHWPADLSGSLEGLRACLWLAGLWYAAPLIARSTAWGPARVMGGIALATGIPLVLGLCAALYPWALWLVLAACVVGRVVRYGARDSRGDAEYAFHSSDAIAIATVFAIAWPVAVRPLMDGDTLIYHLPNAAAWANAHSVWVADTMYWWYPAASELPAAALFSIGGRFALGFAAMPYAALLLWRLRNEAIRAGGSPLLGNAIGAALVSTATAAAQVFSLQNDLALAALFLETIAGEAAFGTWVLAFMKPHGWLFALTSQWARAKFSALAFVPLAIWIGRDAILRHPGGFGSIHSTPVVQTTILAHLRDAALLAPSVVAFIGPVIVAFWAAGVAALVFGDRRLRIAAAVSLIVPLVIPFGFESDMAQFANGHSARIALPLAAIGALFACERTAMRWRAAVTALALLGAAFGIASQWATFRSDAVTSDAPLLTLLVFAAAIGVGSLYRRSAVAARLAGGAVAGLMAAWASSLAAVHPVGYLTDTYDARGGPASAFDYVQSAAPPRAAVWGLPAGAVVMASPSTQVASDFADRTAACAEAQRTGAYLIETQPAAGCASDTRTAGKAAFSDPSIAISVFGPG